MNERKPWWRGLGVIVLLVMALIVMAILATRTSRTLGLHQPLQFDDFFFTIEDARPAPEGFGPPAKGDSDPTKVNYLVRMKVENKALRVPFKFDSNSLAFVDLSGNSPMIRPRAERSSSGELVAPTLQVLKAGESTTTDYLFALPPDQSNLRLRVMPGGAVGDVLEWLFFGRKEFQLPQQDLPRRPWMRQNSVMVKELWRPSLDLALHRNRQSPHVRFVQLATVRETGRPAVRTVVFRGFLGDSHRLTFATDLRSVKAAEIENCPWVEACWYFHLTREQLRFTGTASLVGPDDHDPALRESRLAVWRDMSDESRLTYTWPDPGRPREPLAPFPTQAPDPREPLPHFGLLILEVREVDHLELQGNPQHRWRYTRDVHGRWSGIEINP